MTEEKTEHKPNDAPRITNTQKEKDPRKVEAGKKLGAISKMAKNQKKYKAEAHEAEAQNLNNNNSDYSDYSSPFYAGLAVVVVAGCLGALYWNRKQQPKQDLPKPQDVTRCFSEAPEAPKFRTSLASLPHRETHSNLISLDD